MAYTKRYDFAELQTPSDRSVDTSNQNYNFPSTSSTSNWTKNSDSNWSSNESSHVTSNSTSKTSTSTGTSSSNVVCPNTKTPQVTNSAFTTPKNSKRTPRNVSTNSARSNEPSSIVALVEGRGLARGEVGLACIDLKKPELILSQFSDSTTYVKVISKLQILSPIEILIPHTACENGKLSKLASQIQEQFSAITLTSVQRKYFNETKGVEYIKNLCVPEYMSVELQINSKYYCLATAAALLKYLEFIQNTFYAPHSLRVVFCGSENTCLIDSNSAKNLELTKNLLNPKSDQSLYGVLQHTNTVAGSRLLRANILQPPSDLETIEARLNAVNELTEKEDVFYGVQTVLQKFVDVDHLLSLCVQIPKEDTLKSAENKITQVIYLKHTLELVEPLKNVLESCTDPLLRAYRTTLEDPRYQEMASKISEVIQDDTKYQKGVLNMRAQKCFAVKPNINGLLDVARRSYCETVGDISEMVHQMAEHHNLPLRVVYNASRGFFIQMKNCSAKDNEKLEELSALFVKTTKFRNSVSFTTEDLMKMNDRVRESFNEIYLMSNVIVSELLNQIRDQIICLYKLTDAVSMLDLIASFAHSCTLSNYVRPEFTDTLAIKNGRHPILDQMVDSVANNTYLAQDCTFVIITGPNMSGKSTYLKQVALLQIMAQIGSYIPAEYACFTIVDNIFCRMGCNDDIQTNAATFTVEMRESNYILQNATDKSLVVIDELGRGTGIEEGVGMSIAIYEHLISIKAFTLIATHFHEVTQLDVLYKTVMNYHFQVDEVPNDDESAFGLEYPHVLCKGVNPYENYGIKLAEISTLPTSVVEDAKVIAEQLRRQKVARAELSDVEIQSRAEFHLANRLIQIAKNSRLSEDELIENLRVLKYQFENNINSFAFI